MSDLTIGIEVVEKTEADWLWVVCDGDGSLIDCGHESSPQNVKEQIMLTVESMVTKKIKGLVSKPRVVK